MGKGKYTNISIFIGNYFSEQELNLPEDEDYYLQPKYSTKEKKMNSSHGEAA